VPCLVPTITIALLWWCHVTMVIGSRHLACWSLLRWRQGCLDSWNLFSSIGACCWTNTFWCLLLSALCNTKLDVILVVQLESTLATLCVTRMLLYNDYSIHCCWQVNWICQTVLSYGRKRKVLFVCWHDNPSGTCISLYIAQWHGTSEIGGTVYLLGMAVATLFKGTELLTSLKVRLILFSLLGFNSNS